MSHFNTHLCRLTFAISLLAIFPISRAAVAQAVEVAEGEFQYSISDHYSENRAEEHFEIRDLQTGKITKLKFLKKPGRELQHGMKVRVHGVRKNEEIAVESIEPLSSGGSTALDGTSITSAAIVPVNERKVLVLVVNLLNANSTFTVDGIASQLYSSTNSVAKRYERLTMGHVRLNGDANGDGQYDVFGPYTINLTAPNCNENQWTTAADAAAQAAGVNLSLYTNIIYAMPLYSTLGCTWAGRANISCGSACRTWWAYNHPSLAVHELGHNLGMLHASTDPEDDGITNSEYGDTSDEMGNPYANRNFNAPHLSHMGWLNPFAGAVRSITSAGRYDIATINTNPELSTLPFALKLPRSKGGSYFVSLRQPAGEDATIPLAFTTGANLHSLNGGYSNTHFIKTLATDGAHTDAGSGLTITQLTTPMNGVVSVLVDYTCVSQAPSISFSPSLQTVAPGGTTTYQINVVNRDAPSCASTTFSLSAILPAGVSGTLSLSSLNLAAGSSGSVNLAVTAPVTAGNYSLSSSASAPGHATATAAATLTVKVTKGRGGKGNR